MGARFPSRSIASIEDAIANALTVEGELLSMQAAARDPNLVKYLEQTIRTQRRLIDFLIELRRDADRG